MQSDISLIGNIYTITRLFISKLISLLRS